MTTTTIFVIVLLVATTVFSGWAGWRAQSTRGRAILWGLGTVALLQVVLHISQSNGVQISGFFQTRDVTTILASVLLAWVVRGFSQKTEEIPEDDERNLNDKLTGLPNRRRFVHLLDRTIGREQRVPDFSFAVLMVDLDRFHLVNTSYGREFGDRLLCDVSERLVRVLRPNDIIARIGVDQFLILLHDVKDSSDAFRVAQRVEEQLESPFTIENQDIFTTASIGIVTSESQHKTNEDYIRAAETAMARAKSGGGGRYQLFDERLHDRAVSRLKMENDLRAALNSDQLSLDFQPVLDLDTHRIVGFEALVRWAHPERGKIPPGLFIPFAEEIGLIVPIGEWVLNEACRQAAEWAKQYPRHSPIPISVNISGRQFQSVDIGELVERTVEKHGLPFELLKVEITETAVMEDTDRGGQVVKHLRDLGVQVQLDDFGTGYSSLSQLHKLPVDALKIDRSFVDGAPESTSRTAILRGIVQLGKDLGLRVIAEGIETYDELMLLRRLQCDYGQGYLFSKPVPPERVGALIDGERIATASDILA